MLTPSFIKKLYVLVSNGLPGIILQYPCPGFFGQFQMSATVTQRNFKRSTQGPGVRFFKEQSVLMSNVFVFFYITANERCSQAHNGKHDGRKSFYIGRLDISIGLLH